jgi:hypothetical protein
MLGLSLLCFACDCGCGSGSVLSTVLLRGYVCTVDMLVRGSERQEKRQWAIGDVDKVIRKVDLQAAARTCSQGTRDLLSHGVLPYGASLVEAGVARSPELAEPAGFL